MVKDLFLGFIGFARRPVIHFHTLCMKAAKALVRLHRCAGLTESSFLADEVSINSFLASGDFCHLLIITIPIVSSNRSEYLLMRYIQY